MSIYARDIRCPLCQAALATMAPDYRLTPDPDDLTPIPLGPLRLFAVTCAGGHELVIESRTTPDGSVVQAFDGRTYSGDKRDEGVDSPP